MADWLTALSSVTTLIPRSDCASVFESSICADMRLKSSGRPEKRDRLHADLAGERLRGSTDIWSKCSSSSAQQKGRVANSTRSAVGEQENAGFGRLMHD